MSEAYRLRISNESWLEATNLVQGVFSPISEFMNQKDYLSVVHDMHTSKGEIWTLPITLDIPEKDLSHIRSRDLLYLENNDHQLIGELLVSDVYRVYDQDDLKKIFLTDQISHPGVRKESQRSPYRVGGSVKLYHFYPPLFPHFYFTPFEMKKIFQEKNITQVTGFQTRNPPHLAHEYLQRLALELTGALFIHPLIGWKKSGDFSPEAVVESYKILCEDFYPSSKVFLGTLNVAMRYAGPREAVFHALIRKNFGCTHFIVGRDHAGVGNFYGLYQAQELCQTLGNLGITILAFPGPFYCRKCSSIVTMKTCSHDKEFIIDVSGTEIRNLLKNDRCPPSFIMRQDVASKLLELSGNGKLFCGEESL
jgi:sulfate adenylyltransferase